jgi:PhnB protein
MARTNTYLNFPRNTREVFTFYKSVFGGEFSDVNTFRDVPPMEGVPPMAAEDLDLIMHIELPITGGHVLMGTDAPESMGFIVNFGNNIHISLEPDTVEEATRLFNALSYDGNVTMPFAKMFWGAWFGSFTDKFGVSWMVNCTEK